MLHSVTYVLRMVWRLGYAPRILRVSIKCTCARQQRLQIARLYSMNFVYYASSALHYSTLSSSTLFLSLLYSITNSSLFYSVLYYIAKLRYSYYLSPTRHPTLLRYSFSARQQRLQIAKLYSPARHSTTLL